MAAAPLLMIYESTEQWELNGSNAMSDIRAKFPLCTRELLFRSGRGCSSSPLPSLPPSSYTIHHVHTDVHPARRNPKGRVRSVDVRASRTNSVVFDQIHAAAQAAFRSGRTRSVEFRKAQIAQVGYMLQDNEDRFREALKSDLGRPYQETDLYVPHCCIA